MIGKLRRDSEIDRESSDIFVSYHHLWSECYITILILFCFFQDLGQEAHAIRCHAPLPLDENFGDTRQMLARMAILSNEMLISVELHLSRGLMSKRLGLKVRAYRVY